MKDPYNLQVEIPNKNFVSCQSQTETFKEDYWPLMLRTRTILGSEYNPYTDVEENYFRKIYLVTKNKRKINNRK